MEDKQYIVREIASIVDVENFINGQQEEYKLVDIRPIVRIQQNSYFVILQKKQATKTTN